MLMSKLKEARKGKGMTQSELAKACGISRNSIINWETGKRAPRTVDIERLATVLGISPHDLLGGMTGTLEEGTSMVEQGQNKGENTGSFAYWGKVLDEAQRVARGRNLQEIGIIIPLIKLAYETLVSVQKHEQDKLNAAPNISAYNGNNSNYSGNSLTVGATA